MENPTATNSSTRSLAPFAPPPEQEVTETYTQTARGRITALPFALGLISLGGLLLIEPYLEGFRVTLPVAILIMLGALALTYMFRFFVSERRERGLFFLALLGISMGGVLALISLSNGQLDIQKWYPLILVGAGGALILTFAFEHEHERGVLSLGVLVLVAGLVALTVTLEVIPKTTIETIADYFPLTLAFIGITLIPLALRRS